MRQSARTVLWEVGGETPPTYPIAGLSKCLDSRSWKLQAPIAAAKNALESVGCSRQRQQNGPRFSRTILPN